MDGQTKKQNSMMKAYFWAFVNFEQNDWAQLLPMMEFAYNNVKNASTNHIFFKLNCGYYPYVSSEEDFNLCSKSRFMEKLSSKLQELMTVCQQNLYYA